MQGHWAGKGGVLAPCPPCRSQTIDPPHRDTIRPKEALGKAAYAASPGNPLLCSTIQPGEGHLPASGGSSHPSTLVLRGDANGWSSLAPYEFSVRKPTRVHSPRRWELSPVSWARELYSQAIVTHGALSDLPELSLIFVGVMGKGQKNCRTIVFRTRRRVKRGLVHHLVL